MPGGALLASAPGAGSQRAGRVDPRRPAAGAAAAASPQVHLGRSRPRRMKAVILLSGGLDSYTAGAMARAEGYDLYALTVRYGEVHAREVVAARQVARNLEVAGHIELDVNLAAFGGSSLVRDPSAGDIPKDRELHGESIPSTYVPARNTIFLSLAL